MYDNKLKVSLCFFTDLIPPGVCNLLNPSTIYANNEVNLEEVDIYGFDYDYTLALYSSALDEMIYNKAREFLVQHYKVRERHPTSWTYQPVVLHVSCYWAK